MGPEGSDIYDEGLLIPPCKLVEAGLEATGLKSRRELVDYALRELLRHQHKRKKGNMSIKCKVTWDEVRSEKGGSREK